MKTTYALLIAGQAAQQAAATWNFFDNFNAPQYNDNECSDKQKAGYSWSDLPAGESNFQYDDFDFSGGWSCANSFSKRDIITKRTFSPKVVKNSCSKDKPASFGCDKRTAGFSITEIDVSVQFDVDLELHYKMGDGSTCRQIASCSSSGSTIANTQCGGARSVDVYLSSHYQGSESECEIGFHRIGFDCSSSTTYHTPTAPEIPSSSTSVKSRSVFTPQPSQSTTPATPTGSIATSSACNGQFCNGQSTPEASTLRTSPTSPCDGSSGEGCNTPIPTLPSTISFQTAGHYTNSSSLAYSSPPSYKTTLVAPLPSFESSTVTPQPESSTVVSLPLTSESSSVPSPCDGSYGASCQGSTAVQSPPPSSTGISILSTSAASPMPSSPSYSPANTTDTLPKCMNTWLQISSKCKDNTDTSCYCVDSEFTKNVIDCVTAWCGTDEETKESLQYLIGICADYVPQNPKIIDDCPTYIPLNSSPAPSAGGVTVGVSTTFAASETLPPMTATPVTTITYNGSISLTVPQVHFSTVTVVAGGSTPTQPVGLVPGTAPPQTPAATTDGAAPYPLPSTLGTRTGSGATGTGAFNASSPAQFSGNAAVPLGVVPKGALFGAVLAFLAL